MIDPHPLQRALHRTHKPAPRRSIVTSHQDWRFTVCLIPHSPSVIRTIASTPCPVVASTRQLARAIAGRSASAHRKEAKRLTRKMIMGTTMPPPGWPA